MSRSAGCSTFCLNMDLNRKDPKTRGFSYFLNLKKLCVLAVQISPKFQINAGYLSLDLSRKAGSDVEPMGTRYPGLRIYCISKKGSTESVEFDNSEFLNGSGNGGMNSGSQEQTFY